MNSDYLFYGLVYNSHGAWPIPSTGDVLHPEPVAETPHKAFECSPFIDVALLYFVTDRTRNLHQVRYIAQQMTTPEDASIPNTPITGIATALSMSDIIQHHAAESANGLTYAQMGRFAVESGDPAGTNNAEEALKDAKGKPVTNQGRNTQLTAASLVTSLSL